MLLDCELGVFTVQPKHGQNSGRHFFTFSRSLAIINCLGNNRYVKHSYSM